MPPSLDVSAPRLAVASASTTNAVHVVTISTIQELRAVCSDRSSRYSQSCDSHAILTSFSACLACPTARKQTNNPQHTACQCQPGYGRRAGTAVNCEQNLCPAGQFTDGTTGTLFLLLSFSVYLLSDLHPISVPGLPDWNCIDQYSGQVHRLPCWYFPIRRSLRDVSFWYRQFWNGR